MSEHKTTIVGFAASPEERERMKQLQQRLGFASMSAMLRYHLAGMIRTANIFFDEDAQETFAQNGKEQEQA